VPRSESSAHRRRRRRYGDEDELDLGRNLGTFGIGSDMREIGESSGTAVKVRVEVIRDEDVAELTVAVSSARKKKKRASRFARILMQSKRYGGHGSTCFVGWACSGLAPGLLLGC
jgi:hypothetical protein